ncbi:phospholipase A-2-activating protein [Mycena floridula]|nr:phospholipase A-2-activating protein [Mycena floridula]
MVYKLSAILSAHSSDVRSVASPTNELVLSASRDTTAIGWLRTPENPSFTKEYVFQPGSRYVNAVAFLPPSPDAPKGCVVTGGQDTIVNVFSLSDQKNFELLGHTENVCVLDTTPSGTIVSGSWDKTARVWKNFQLAYELKGHQQAVWAVLALDEEQCLTGSADNTIKLWQQHKLINTFNGHKQAVRGLARVPDIGFASCSNDSEIHVWTLGGDLVYTLSGHTSFVYSLSVLPNGDIVSGGEDRSVRVWKDGECSQAIIHPAISVWAVSTMPNGDIVSGCSDGIVRVFSADEARWASAEDIKEYDEQVASQTLPKEQVGDLKKNNLPGPDALNNPGSKNGEQKMILDSDGQVWLYTWDGTSWQKVGTVVDAVGSSRKQLYEGKEYDYVFDVDIQDGVPPLKLPFNVTENPYVAAQKFLEKNDLPLTYLDEVVRFIESNTEGVKLGAANEDYVDPFTGASRYRSSGASASNTGSSSSYVDPYTGASRYTAAPAPAPAPSASNTYMDPFTGASRYSGAPAAPAAAPATRVIPSIKYIAFKQVKDVSAVQNKMYELDGVLKQEISTSGLAMYPEDISCVDETFIALSHLTATPPETPPHTLNATHVDAISQILDRWPASQCFPVIDLGRLLTAYSPSLFADDDLRQRFFRSLFKAAEFQTPWETPLPKARDTNILLVLKALANVFQDGYISNPGWLAQIIAVLDHIPYLAIGKTQRGAFATVLFNISCLSLRTPLEQPLRDQHLGLLLKVIQTEPTEAEPTYRSLVGLGNAIHAMKSKGTALTPEQASEIARIVAPASTKFPQDVRIQNVSKELSALL